MKRYRISTSVTFAALLYLGGCLGPSSNDDSASVEQFTFGGDLLRNLGSPVVTNTTVDRTNDYQPTCITNSAAPDMSYTWTAPSTGSYTFSTVGSSFDTILEIRRYNTTASLGCNDDSPGLGLLSKVNVSLAVGETVMIVVDGFGTNRGLFKLNISLSTFCGDSSCNGSETCSSCPGDCGRCVFCGDGICEGAETSSNCPGDCGSPGGLCGDGICSFVENQSCTCLDDCGCQGNNCPC